MRPAFLFVGGLLFPCFHLLTVRKFLYTFFGQPRRTRIRYAAWIAYYILQAAPSLGIIILPPIRLLLNVLFIFIVSTFSCRSGVKNRCIFSVLIIAVWMLEEVAVGIVLKLFGMEGWGLKAAGTAISNMCMFVIAVVVGHYAKGEDRPELSLQYVAAVILITSGTIYMMHYIFLIVAEHMEFASFAIGSSLFLLFLNYTAFGVYEKLAQDADAKERSLLYEQKLELLSRQSEEREAYDIQIRRMRHDLRNHMTGLLGVLHDGDREQAEEYIRLMLKDSADCRAQDVSRSGNAVVDAIVNYKCSQAQKEGIVFDANVFLPSGLPFRAGHLAIIFGNLLDNALEACRELEDRERWIRLEASYAKEVLMISVSNPCNERKKDRDGRFGTTKKDRRNHGLGLSSVERAVEPYQGLLEVGCADGLFHAVVVMYGNNGEK